MNEQEIQQAHDLIVAIREGLDKLDQLIQTPFDLTQAQIIPAPLPSTGFQLSHKSRNELQGVDSRLVECVEMALFNFTEVDFMVFDGLRTQEEQFDNVRRGVSKTMNSKHLTGHAVDLVPIIGGVPKWDWEGCAKIAYAMDRAATHLGYADLITWGGAWDRTLGDYNYGKTDYLKAVEEYKQRHEGPDFIDGPHFEIKKGE